MLGYRGVCLLLNVEGRRSFALSVWTKRSHEDSREGAETMIAIHCWMGITNAIYQMHRGQWLIFRNINRCPPKKYRQWHSFDLCPATTSLVLLLIIVHLALCQLKDDYPIRAFPLKEKLSLWPIPTRREALSLILVSLNRTQRIQGRVFRDKLHYVH